ncbi:MAG: oxygen-independent coproporphyrinogen III oxidase [Deltaproteobacteria bacterium]|nr:oxygen-independent coproporphyrinogen III oxidase [Deltaproteobacteria bacterium]
MDSRLLQLLQKYDVPGPRYTSYPTVPAWTSDVGKENYKKALREITGDACGRAPDRAAVVLLHDEDESGRTRRRQDPLSLYFHLPFCESLCHFCGCMQVITKDHARSREYVDVLLTELDRIGDLLPKDTREVVQLHFGGGTPNFLQPEELKEIVDRVRKHFHLLSDAEIAIELHPRTSTEAFCEMLAELKFNRISLGVQDFDPTVQKLIHRNQTYEMTEEMVTLLRKLGFQSFNFDLVYGLPGQTMKGWKETLKKVLYLHPDRLAVYSYAHVPWVRPVQRSFKDSDLPPPELKLQLFEKAYETFTQNGYRHIGIDHFALKEDELSRALDNETIHRNFMGYSTRADAHQIGFGVSSISYVGGNYFQNKKELRAYYESIRQGQLATFRGFCLNRDDTLRRDLITRIMCRGRVDIPAFEKAWDIRFADYFAEDVSRLKTFADDGLLAIDENKIRAVNEGTLFLRNIAMAFDRYLEGVRSHAKTPVFSRTV